MLSTLPVECKRLYGLLNYVEDSLRRTCLPDLVCCILAALQFSHVRRPLSCIDREMIFSLPVNKNQIDFTALWELEKNMKYLSAKRGFEVNFGGKKNPIRKCLSCQMLHTANCPHSLQRYKSAIHPSIRLLKRKYL